MDFEIPANESIKTALAKSDKNNCLRYSYFYSEVQNYSRKDARSMSMNLYDAMQEPWQSIPDINTASQDILYVAKHAVWFYIERELADVLDESIEEFDKFLEANRKMNENGRKIYDDIISLWNDRAELSQSHVSKH